MCRRACRLPRSHIYNKVWRGGRVCRRACRLPRSHIYNKVWQGERVCRRVTGCTRRVLVSCGMAVSVFLRCGRSLFVLGVDFRGAKLMFFFVKTHFLCFFHRICVGFCVRRRFCLAKTARNRGGDVCGWECGCARRGAAAFAVGSAVVRGEGRRRLRVGVRLCTERGGDVCVLWWVVFRMVPCICLLACLPSWRGMTGICWARCVVFRVPRALRILAPWCVCSC